MDEDLKINTGSGSWNEDFADRYLGLVATHRTEQEVVLAEILNAGISPNPKEGWKDPLPSP
jgi:hypothetical protein